jgi:hypothetical protein
MLIFPQGVMVSRGSAFETGHALRQSFGQKTQVSSAARLDSSVGSARMGRKPGRDIDETTSVVREGEIVIADPEHVTFRDLFSSDALPVELDAIGRPHVDHEVRPVLELDHRVLARHVRILQSQIARLLAAADDEAVLRNGKPLSLVNE